MLSSVRMMSENVRLVRSRSRQVIDTPGARIALPPRRALGARGAGAGNARARGFTLIEIVVAFAILAIGLGIAMQIATGAMRNAKVAAERTEAALYAQSLLDGVGIGERLEEGDSRGEFGDTYRWTLSVTPYEVPSDVTSLLDPQLAPVRLYRLELVVTWGSARREREARFVTLRALTPDVGA
jgi:general secretion pathway protein I